MTFLKVAKDKKQAKFTFNWREKLYILLLIQLNQRSEILNSKNKNYIFESNIFNQNNYNNKIIFFSWISQSSYHCDRKS